MKQHKRKDRKLKTKCLKFQLIKTLKFLKDILILIKEILELL